MMCLPDCVLVNAMTGRWRNILMIYWIIGTPGTTYRLCCVPIVLMKRYLLNLSPPTTTSDNGEAPPYWWWGTFWTEELSFSCTDALILQPWFQGSICVSPDKGQGLFDRWLEAHPMTKSSKVLIWSPLAMIYHPYPKSNPNPGYDLSPLP